MFSFLHQYSNNDDDDDDGDDDDVLKTSQETERWETKHFIGMAKLSLLQEPMGSWFALIFFALLSIFVRIKKMCRRHRQVFEYTSNTRVNTIFYYDFEYVT